MWIGGRRLQALRDHVPIQFSGEHLDPKCRDEGWRPAGGARLAEGLRGRHPTVCVYLPRQHGELPGHASADHRPRWVAAVTRFMQ